MSSPWGRISLQGWQSLSSGEMNSYSGICIFTYKRYLHFEHDFRKFFKDSAMAEGF